MALDTASKLGKLIGDNISKQGDIQENISPNDTAPIDTIRNSEELVVEGVMTLTRYHYASNSFVIDHPVYGELDSAILKIDGGYASAISPPIVIPVKFTSEEVVGTYLL